MNRKVQFAALYVLAWALACRADCPNLCSSESGGGRCVNLDRGHVFKRRTNIAPNRTCICEPGHGGQDCSFRMQSLFFDHDVYQGLETVPVDLYGWNNDNTSVTFYEQICEELKPNLVIEVGVWKGQSVSHLAGWLKDHKQGALLAVDTWLGAPEFWLLGPTDPSRYLHWRNGYPQVYYTFLSNIVSLGLEQYVIPFPAPSRLAFTVLNRHGVQADLIHIDAAHEYEDVLEDIKLWWELLAPKGVLFGDDFGPENAWPGVRRAVEEFAALQKLSYSVHGVKWYMRKPAVASPENEE